MVGHVKIVIFFFIQKLLFLKKSEFRRFLVNPLAKLSKLNWVLSAIYNSFTRVVQALNIRRYGKQYNVDVFCFS